MQDITIHKATATDAAEILSMQQALAAYEGQESIAELSQLEAMLAGAQEPQCHCLLARHNDAPAGFILFYPGYDLSSSSYGFHLSDIFVDEVHRSQGIGKRLLSALALQAEAENRLWISLTALDSNSRAVSFYQYMGFTEMEVRFFAIGHSGIARLAAK